jgi:long-chain fatty acid transport protein
LNLDERVLIAARGHARAQHRLGSTVRSSKLRLIALLCPLVLAVTERHAEAGGLFFSERGVRPLGRGGAFVAGADDLHAVWYNPAGLADAGDSLLLDASWLNFSAEFARKSQVVDGAGAVREYDYPSVNGSSKFIPIPTLGWSVAFGRQKQFTFGLSVFAPYVPLTSWPTQVGGGPAPSRYSLINSDGSALLFPSASFAWKIHENIRIGASFQVLAGTFNSYQVLSSNPSDRLVGAPEDPRYDTYTKIAATLFSPSGVVGVTAIPTRKLRLGLAVQLPFWVNASASIKTQLPSAPIFDNARQEGDTGTLVFRLPPILRVGAQYMFEFSDDRSLRIEAGYTREFWSFHDRVELRSSQFALRGVTGFPDPFRFGNIILPRNFQDSNSFRIGAEYTRKGPVRNGTLALRAGVQYETSAIPDSYISPLALDSEKFTPSIGVGIGIGPVRLDAVFAYVYAAPKTVDPAEAALTRINPAAGNPTTTEAINGGDYRFRAQVLGLGATYRY